MLFTVSAPALSSARTCGLALRAASMYDEKSVVPSGMVSEWMNEPP